MPEDPITPSTRVVEALLRPPNGLALFRVHGFDPTIWCGPSVHVLTLREASASCGLRDLGALIDELNADLVAQATSR